MTLIQRFDLSGSSSAGGVPAVRGEESLSFELRHAGPAEVCIRYELVGRADAPLVIVAGGISAGRHAIASEVFSDAGWWQSQAGALDPSAHRLLSIDWIGADGLLDQPIDPADQADALASLLGSLSLGPAAGFIGASYGGMVAMHLAARHYHAAGAVLAISASARAHPFSSACRSLQRRAVALGESIGDPEAGVALARAMAMLTYRTPAEFADRFNALPTVENGRLRVDADDYLEAHGQRHCRKMSAPAYRRLSESIDLHHIDPAAIRLPVTLVGVDQDSLVPAEDIRALAEALANARFHLIHSRFGHDAFLKEDGQVGLIISQFLASLETAR